MRPPRKESDARRRILETARDLFYTNGYRATGINELIEKSGVAKATFYAHFPSKEDLALAYVRSMNEIETRLVEDALAKHSGPFEKLVGLFDFLIPWARERDYRGCAYLNLSSEVLDHVHPVREESRNHYKSLRVLVGRLMQDLKKERGRAWKAGDPEKAADDFLLLFAGAMALAQVYHDPKPFREAMDAVKRLWG